MIFKVEFVEEVVFLIWKFLELNPAFNKIFIDSKLFNEITGKLILMLNSVMDIAANSGLFLILIMIICKLSTNK